MIAIRPVRPRPASGFTAALLAGTLLFAGCGSSGSSGEAAEDGSTTTAASSDRTGTDQTGDGSTPEGGGGPSGTITALVPIDGEAADGMRMVRAACQVPDADPDDTEYFSDIAFATPDTWESNGRSSGGSGSVLGTSADLSFDTGGDGRLKVGYDWDSRGANGEVVDWNGDPWESFDYEHSLGDDTVQITFDEVGTATIGDQDVTVFHLDPAQAPDRVSADEYRTRIEILEESEVQNASKMRPVSLVLTIVDPDAVLDAEGAIAIIESINLPSCSWEEIVDGREYLRQADLDGDGSFKTHEEMQAELAEMQAELEAELEAQRAEIED